MTSAVTTSRRFSFRRTADGMARSVGCSPSLAPPAVIVIRRARRATVPTPPRSASASGPDASATRSPDTAPSRTGLGSSVAEIRPHTAANADKAPLSCCTAREATQTPSRSPPGAAPASVSPSVRWATVEPQNVLPAVGLLPRVRSPIRQSGTGPRWLTVAHACRSPVLVGCRRQRRVSSPGCGVRHRGYRHLGDPHARRLVSLAATSAPRPRAAGRLPPCATTHGQVLAVYPLAQALADNRAGQPGVAPRGPTRNRRQLCLPKFTPVRRAAGRLPVGFAGPCAARAQAAWIRPDRTNQLVLLFGHSRTPRRSALTRATRSL